MALTTPELTRQILGVVYVLARQDAPPGGPASGDRYIVGATPSGAWVGHANAFAKWNGAAWIFQDPTATNFWGAYSIADAAYWGYSGAAWVQLTAAQSLGANLTAFAALVGAADQLPYFTGVGALSLTTLTAAARSVLDDATVAAMLATLGGLPLAGGTLTGALRQTPTAVTAAANVFTLDLSVNNRFQAATALAANYSIVLTNFQDGDSATFAIKQDGTGGRSLTAITAAGRTVRMAPGTLTSLNPPAALAVGAVLKYTIDFYTAGGTAYVEFGIASSTAAAF